LQDLGFKLFNPKIGTQNLKLILKAGGVSVIGKSGALRRYHSWLSMGQRLADALAVFALLPALSLLRELPYGQPYQVTAVLGALLTWVAMGAVDAYRPWRGASLLPDDLISGILI